MTLASVRAGRLGPRLVVACGAAALLAAVLLVLRAGEAPKPGARSTHLVVVAPGLGVSDVARLLARRGLIRSTAYFEVLALVTGRSAHLEAGTYRLSPGMTPEAVLRRLSLGEVATVDVTVVPGMTVAEVAQVAAKAGLVSARAFLRYARAASPPPGFVVSAGVRQPLEGYLYPDTYRIVLGSPPSAIVAPMLAAFARAFGPEEVASARAEGLTPAQVVTLASIVQREASAAVVRRKVAGVFLNRLHAGMPLGSDATVYYAAHVAPGRPLTAAELASASPYNTLRRSGLPPGPIDSPGGGALAAALHPAKVPYLYFFAKPNGQFVFSRTYLGQLAAQKAAG